MRTENTINCPEAFTVYRAEPAATPASSPQPTPGAGLTCPPARFPSNPKTLLTQRVPELKPKRAWQPLRRSVTDMPRRTQLSRAAPEPHRSLTVCTP